jgi:hypothetical protein
MLYLILDQFVNLRQFSIDGYWDKENEVVHTSVVFVGLKQELEEQVHLSMSHLNQRVRFRQMCIFEVEENHSIISIEINYLLFLT